MPTPGSPTALIFVMLLIPWVSAVPPDAFGLNVILLSRWASSAFGPSAPVRTTPADLVPIESPRPQGAGVRSSLQLVKKLLARYTALLRCLLLPGVLLPCIALLAYGDAALDLSSRCARQVNLACFRNNGPS